MGNLVKSIKNVGMAMNGIEPVGKVVTEVLTSLGTTATGQTVSGFTIADIINDFADKLSAEPIELSTNGLTAYGKIVNAIKRLGIAMNGVEPDGKLISKVLKSLGEDATSATINGYMIADILNDIADKWIHLSLAVQPVAGNVTELGKLVSDLQSNISIGSNGISGTLHYVTGYTGFSGDPAEQSGHYIALKATASEPARITAQVIGGTHGAVTLDSDGEIICRIANNSQSIRFIAKAQEETFTVEYALTNLVLAYNVATTITNGTATGAQTIAKNGTASVTLAANTGYNLPASITVVGASYTYDNTTGVITLSNPTANVTITAVCTAITYPIVNSVTNGSASGDNSIAYGGTASVVLAASSGYILPSSISVSGASYTYDSTTGVVSLSAPTGNVSITAVCEAAQPAGLIPFVDGVTQVKGIVVDPEVDQSVLDDIDSWLSGLTVSGMLALMTVGEGDQGDGDGAISVMDQDGKMLFICVNNNSQATDMIYYMGGTFYYMDQRQSSPAPVPITEKTSYPIADSSRWGVAHILSNEFATINGVIVGAII